MLDLISTKILSNIDTLPENAENGCFQCNIGGEQPAAGAKKWVFHRCEKGIPPRGWGVSEKFKGNKPRYQEILRK